MFIGESVQRAILFYLCKTLSSENCKYNIQQISHISYSIFLLTLKLGNIGTPTDIGKVPYSFTLQRMIQLRICISKSRTVNMTAGIPQRSLVAPTLYKIYTIVTTIMRTSHLLPMQRPSRHHEQPTYIQNQNRRLGGQRRNKEKTTTLGTNGLQHKPDHKTNTHSNKPHIQEQSHTRRGNH